MTPEEGEEQGYVFPTAGLHLHVLDGLEVAAPAQRAEVPLPAGSEDNITVAMLEQHSMQNRHTIARSQESGQHTKEDRSVKITLER